MADLDLCDEFGFPVGSAEALHLHHLRVIDLARDLRSNPATAIGEPPLPSSPSTTEENDMRITEIFPSAFLSAADLQGQEVAVEIESVEIEEFEGERKPVIAFKGKSKKLVCNRTNAASIAALLGDDDTESWPGSTIVLKPATVLFMGKPVDAIRISDKREPAKPRRKPEVKAPPSVNFEDDIPF